MRLSAFGLGLSAVAILACSPAPGPAAPSPSAAPSTDPSAAPTASAAPSTTAAKQPVTPCEKAWSDVPATSAGPWTLHDVKPDVADKWVGYWTVGVLEECDYFLAVRKERGQLAVYASSCGGLPVTASVVTVEIDSLSVDGNWVASNARSIWTLFQDTPDRATGKVLSYAPGFGPSADPPKETPVTFMKRCSVL